MKSDSTVTRAPFACDSSKPVSDSQSCRLSPALIVERLKFSEGVEVRVARIFNTFGSRMHMNDGRVVSNFILQALQGEPLTDRLRVILLEDHTLKAMYVVVRVYGAGSQTRAFQYVRLQVETKGYSAIPQVHKYLCPDSAATFHTTIMELSAAQHLGIEDSGIKAGPMALSPDSQSKKRLYKENGFPALMAYWTGSFIRRSQEQSDSRGGRGFLQVGDLVNGLVSLMNSNISSPVNLGNPEEHTILEFAQLIKSLVASRSHIQFLPEAQDDPQRRRPDIRKAKLLLGWEPVVPLEEGLNKTIQYFSRELEHQANNQYIPKPKAARMKKGRPRHT
ncbi:hypothetical protein DNTS_013352 [Danionella cerebrum]|uniref:UDP-glucuronate decarboxylase n=1 Tax=Danionella cerebrum TaxID=2873325 RepID=A0A553MKR9_9TELE|nr:hypothetical protein DNTS_013352 [Danionella translucida]